LGKHRSERWTAPGVTAKPEVRWHAAWQAQATGALSVRSRAHRLAEDYENN